MTRGTKKGEVGVNFAMAWIRLMRVIRKPRINFYRPKMSKQIKWISSGSEKLRRTDVFSD